MPAAPRCEGRRTSWLRRAGHPPSPLPHGWAQAGLSGLRCRGPQLRSARRPGRHPAFRTRRPHRSPAPARRPSLASARLRPPLRRGQPVSHGGKRPEPARRPPSSPAGPCRGAGRLPVRRAAGVHRRSALGKDGCLLLAGSVQTQTGPWGVSPSAAAPATPLPLERHSRALWGAGGPGAGSAVAVPPPPAGRAQRPVLCWGAERPGVHAGWGWRGGRPAGGRCSGTPPHVAVAVGRRAGIAHV